VPGIHVLTPAEQEDVDGADGPGHDWSIFAGVVCGELVMLAGKWWLG
jgi:hypothetical protein